LKLRFFADQCDPNEIITKLSAEGFSIIGLRDHLPIGAPDEAVISKALELDAVLLSLNGVNPAFAGLQFALLNE